MAFSFEQLNEETRASMLDEFESEQGSNNPYFGKNLSNTGRIEFRKAMVTAIKDGNEETLTIALDNGAYWNPTEDTNATELFAAGTLTFGKLLSVLPIQSSILGMFADSRSLVLMLALPSARYIVLVNQSGRLLTAAGTKGPYSK